MPQKIFIFLLLITCTCSLAQKQEPRLVLPVGHTSLIKSLSFSPDGKLILTSSWDKTARLWEFSTGKELQLFFGHLDYIQHSNFNASGTQIVTASDDSTAKIWDASSGKIIKTIKNQHQTDFAAFSENGKNIITSSYDNTIRIWEINSGELIKLIKYDSLISSKEIGFNGKYFLVSSDTVLNIIETSSGEIINTINENEDIYSAKLSRDSKMALITDVNGTIRILDINSRKTLNTFYNKGFVASAMFNNIGSYILFSYDSVAVLRDIISGKIIKEFNHSDVIKSVQISSDDKLVITCGYDSTFIVWSAETGKIIFKNSSNDWLESAIFSLNGKQVISTGWDKVLIWDIASGKETTILSGNCTVSNLVSLNENNGLVLNDSSIMLIDIFSGKLKKVFNGHLEKVISSAFGPDNELIVSTGSDSTIRIWNIDKGEEIYSFRGQNNRIRFTSSNIYENLLLTSDIVNNLNRWDIESGKLIQKYIGHRGEIYESSFSSNGKLVLTASADSTVRIWDTNTGKSLQVLIGHKSAVHQAVFISNDTLVLTSSMDGTARIWETATGKEIILLTGHKGYIRQALVSSNKKFLLTYGNDQTARIWDFSTGNELFKLKHFSEVLAASFSPDNKFIITCGDKDLHIYRTNNGQLIQKLIGHNTIPFNCILNNIGNIAYTSSSDKTIRCWNVDSGKLLYTRIQLENNDYLYYDEHYRFDGTPGAIEKLYFVCGLEVVELDQIKDSLYVPNLVQRIMNGENLDHLPKLSDLNICGVTPVVEPLENDKSGNQGYRIIPRSGGVGDVDVYINGVVRLSTNSKKLKRKDGNYMLYVEKELLELYQIPGEETKVKVIAKTANNSISSRGVVIDIESDEKTTFKKPALHAIMIGVDDYKGDGLDLNYAAKDANDLQTVLQKSAQKFFNIDDTSRVHFYNLTVNRSGANGNEKIKGITPDRTNIINTIAEIEKTSKPEDILLLFFAGHGEIVDKDQLLLLTSESSREDFKGLRMRELLELLNKVPAGKRVLILDACHSGAAINNLDMSQLTGKRDVKDAERQSQRLKELDKLASKSGFAIITASSSDQKALELPQYEHGLMTYALLNSMLNNKNALDEDNKLQLEKWLMATEEEVKKLNQNQSAERMVPINFTLGKVDDEVRSSIVLREIPTVHVSNVLNIDLGFDDQKIKSQMITYFSEKSRGTEKTLFVSEIEQPNSVQVNVVYSISKNQITLKVTLLKNNEVLKRMEKSGALSNQTILLNELMSLIENELE